MPGTPQLRAFLPRDNLRAIGRELGAPFDPTLLVGLSMGILVAPAFSPRWHVQAHVLAVSRDAHASLDRLATEGLRQELRTSGLYDRQRHPP